jgi:peptidoglycan/xylan/chitin deacetylase (PgdA/CDA1 family)
VFEHEPLRGTSLPQGTLTLTFDDGPGASSEGRRGPKTQQLAEYLAAEGIPATFFACGKHLAELPGIVERLRSLGHTVANHTHDHPNLTTITPADVVAQVAATDALIRDSADDVLFFRAPYGSWSVDVAEALNADAALASGYVGPVHWDVDGDDWAAWRDAVSPEVIAATYLEAVSDAGRGIVLMHDSTADHDDWLVNNAAFEMVQLLVPELKRRGYAFAPLADALAL